MQYPSLSLLLLASITVLRCEVSDRLSAVVCCTVKTYTADGVFLTVVTAVPSLHHPSPVITAFRAQYYVVIV